MIRIANVITLFFLSNFFTFPYIIFSLQHWDWRLRRRVLTVSKKGAHLTESYGSKAIYKNSAICGKCQNCLFLIFSEFTNTEKSYLLRGRNIVNHFFQARGKCRGNCCYCQRDVSAHLIYLLRIQFQWNPLIERKETTKGEHIIPHQRTGIRPWAPHRGNRSRYLSIQLCTQNLDYYLSSKMGFPHCQVAWSTVIHRFPLGRLGFLCY